MNAARLQVIGIRLVSGYVPAHHVPDIINVLRRDGRLQIHLQIPTAETHARDDNWEAKANEVGQRLQAHLKGMKDGDEKFTVNKAQKPEQLDPRPDIVCFRLDVKRDEVQEAETPPSK